MSWNNSYRKFNRDHNERKEAAGGKDFKPWAMERVDLVVGDTFMVRILMPESGQTFSKAYHWPSGKPPLACTKDHPMFVDPDTNEGRCNYCIAYPKKSRGQRKIDDVLEVIDFRYLHIVPDTKRGGDAETVVTCLHDEPESLIRSNRCHNCNSPSPRTSERHFGGHKVLELKGYQYDQLWATHEKLSAHCVGNHAGSVCNTKSYLLCFICEHCEEMMLNEEMTGRMPAPTQRQFANARQTCRHCDVADYPYGIYACDGGGRTPTPGEVEKQTDPADGEHWVIPGSMFSKPLEVFVAGQEKKMKDGKTITLRNLNISTGAEWSTVEADLEGFGITGEEAAEMCAPLDLRKRYRPSYKLNVEDYKTPEEYVQAVLSEQAETAGMQPGGGAQRNFQGNGSRRSFRS